MCDCTNCSSEESAKAKTQKEVIKTLKELKLHLPPEKRHNNKSSTVNTLKYALRCVKQVAGKIHSHPTCLSSLCFCPSCVLGSVPIYLQFRSLFYCMFPMSNIYTNVVIICTKRMSFLWLSGRAAAEIQKK